MFICLAVLGLSCRMWNISSLCSLFSLYSWLCSGSCIHHSPTTCFLTTFYIFRCLWEYSLEKAMVIDSNILTKIIPWTEESGGLQWSQRVRHDVMQRSLVGCSPWGRKESDTTEQLIWSDLIWITLFYWNIPSILFFFLFSFTLLFIFNA